MTRLPDGMSNPDLEPRLRSVLAEVSRKDVSHIGLDDDLVQALGLDSLAALWLLAAVEKRFGVRFSDQQLEQYRTLRQLYDYIAAYPGE
jgi:acyl carrier protein